MFVSLSSHLFVLSFVSMAASLFFLCFPLFHFIFSSFSFILPFHHLYVLSLHFFFFCVCCTFSLFLFLLRSSSIHLFSFLISCLPVLCITKNLPCGFSPFHVFFLFHLHNFLLQNLSRIHLFPLTFPQSLLPLSFTFLSCFNSILFFFPPHSSVPVRSFFLSSFFPFRLRVRSSLASTNHDTKMGCWDLLFVSLLSLLLFHPRSLTLCVFLPSFPLTPSIFCHSSSPP